MSILDILPTQTFIQALGWTLLHFVWQGAALAILLAIVNSLLKRATANVRYTVACGALLLMMVLPAVTLWRNFTPTTNAPVIAVAEETVVNTIKQPLAKFTASALPAAAASAWSKWPSRLTAALPWLVTAWLLGVMLLS